MQAKERVTRVIEKERGCDRPGFWMTVIPAFPWQNVWQLTDCRSLVDSFPGAERLQRLPNGAMAIAKELWSIGGNQLATPQNNSVVTACANGHVHLFHGIIITERSKEQRVHYGECKHRFDAMAETVRKYYQSRFVKVSPGTLLIWIGISGIKGFRFYTTNGFCGQPYIDDDYLDETYITFEEFLQEKCLQPLLQRLAYGLDIVVQPQNIDS